MTEIIIFGCGGVGAWTAELLARLQIKKPEIFTKLTLVDGDYITQENLWRQPFTTNQIGEFKTYATKNNIKSINRYLNVQTKNEFINKPEQLLEFNKTDIAIITTDNVTSKKLIGSYFNQFYLVNCDFGKVELKSYLDSTEIGAWDLGGGYSLQDPISNLFASLLILSIFLYPEVSTKINENSNLLLNLQKFITSEGKEGIIKTVQK